MKSLCIMITKPAFGMIHAAEAIRLVNGALSYGHKVALVLVEDGILIAKKGQNAEEGGWTSLSSLVEKLSTSAKITVLADIEDAEELGITQNDLAHGVKLVELSKIASTLVSSDRTAIF